MIKGSKMSLKSKMKMSNNLKGKNGLLSRNWKGGLQKRHGRFYLTLPTGRIARYIHFIEVHLGRKLNKDEVVHHINGDKTDDRIENLEVMTRSEHNKLHMLQRMSLVKLKDSDIDKIKDMYFSKLTLKEIGKRFNKSISTIHNVVKNKAAYKISA